MTLITDNESLRSFCRRQASAPFVTVDTEFLRDSTFFPRLCLVQVGGPEEVAAIDALADSIELEPLFELLSEPHVLKVFHSARQDMEIFYNLMDGDLPKPIFDTQVAAMVCGFGDQVAYDKLARRIAGAEIDKSSRFADWSKRPLTERQLRYALSDVTHLRQVYESLRGQLERSGRAGWLDEEMAVLTDPATYRQDPELAWQRLKVRSTDRRYLAVLREVAAWREREAQRRDVPRNRVLRDEQIQDIAAHAPRDRTSLARTRGLSSEFASGRLGAGVLQAIETALELPRDARPSAPARPEVPPGQRPLMELLKVLLKTKCEEHGVAQKLVATTVDLESIAASDDANVAALRGWRREIFGEAALRLKQGRLALAADDRGVKLIDMEG